MSEQEYNFKPHEIKIVSPLERLVKRTREIATISELDETQTAHLQRYANVYYRIRDIQNTFNKHSTSRASYKFGEEGEEPQEILLTFENYYLWIENLKAQAQDLIETYFDKDKDKFKKMDTARKEVAQIVRDITPRID